MTLDPHTARFLDMVSAANAAIEAKPRLEDYRRGYEKLWRFAATPDPRLCATRDLETKSAGRSIPLRLYEPTEASDRPLPLMVWLHGGGWIAGGTSSYDALCRSLSIASLCRIAAVDFRLAPEHPFPAGLDDCLAVVSDLWDRAEELGSTKADFALGAESAGAHLAAGLVPLACQSGVRFKFAFFLCPVLDPFGVWPSRRVFSTGYLLEDSALSDYIRFYGANLDPDDDRVSPLRSRRLGDFPPTVIHTAECDPVCDEGEAFAAALQNAGVPVRCVRHDGLIHNFYGLTSVIPEARRALEDVGASLASAWA
jgi:acetyl esterase